MLYKSRISDYYMYDMKYLGLKQIASYLGLSRDYALKLCQMRPHGFPVIKVGNQYRSDEDKLSAWRDRWFAGEFEIDFK